MKNEKMVVSAAYEKMIVMSSVEKEINFEERFLEEEIDIEIAKNYFNVDSIEMMTVKEFEKNHCDIEGIEEYCDDIAQYTLCNNEKEASILIQKMKDYAEKIEVMKENKTLIYVRADQDRYGNCWEIYQEDNAISYK